jgi:hypothetical protein
MNTGDQSQSLNIRIRGAIQHVVRVIERDWFDVLVFCSVACTWAVAPGSQAMRNWCNATSARDANRMHSNES